MIEDPRVTHGLTRHPLYPCYSGMIARCYNPKAPNYRWYGGRGIKVCNRWLYGDDDTDKIGLEYYIEDIGKLGPKPSPKHSLDRIDNDGHYEPDNVRWATQKDQLKNRRQQGCTPRRHNREPDANKKIIA